MQACSSEVKQPGHEGDHAPPCSTKFKNAYNYSSSSPYIFMVWCLINHRTNFAFFYNHKCQWSYTELTANAWKLNEADINSMGINNRFHLLKSYITTWAFCFHLSAKLKFLFFNWLFSNSVSIKTVALDERMINECGAISVMRFSGHEIYMCNTNINVTKITLLLT